ncbi:MAG: ATP-binding cassette domain-containing protein [Mycobacterium kyogaense]|uniref:ATP-binding cassette domain-containing protein n=1 Tax=Mycobacterium kyogaense TaxID=2212479 RepID=UPI002FF9BD38
MNKTLLTIRDLTVDAPSKAGTKRLLNGVTLIVGAGEAVALVGESGSGKSLTTRSVMRLLPGHFVVGGTIEFDGADVLAMKHAELQRFRGRDVGMIFQDPRAHINPVHRVDDFLTEALRTTRGVSRSEAEDRAVTLLAEVGVRNPASGCASTPTSCPGDCCSAYSSRRYCSPNPLCCWPTSRPPPSM